MSKIPWTKPEIDELLNLWKQQKVASEIAYELNIKFFNERSRDAVLGIVHRLRAKGIRVEERGSPLNRGKALKNESASVS